MDTLSYNHIDTTVLIPLKEFSPHIFLGKSDHTVESLLYIVGFFIVFAVIRLRGKDLLATWLSAFFLKKRVEIIQNDGIIPNLFYYLLALGLSCSIFAIGITFYQVHNLELKSILLIMGSLLAWHFSSLFIVSVTGWTFGSKNIAEEGGVNIWIYNIMMGLL
ncbi:DUF4271 domain-containing protein, partial [Odoribacter sp. OttesenSCG-928-A06]|nr:DUF4271 domain-containing protein [Odoribacter sp. OttesenSCG-928-A06]